MHEIYRISLIWIIFANSRIGYGQSVDFKYFLLAVTMGSCVLSSNKSIELKWDLWAGDQAPPSLRSWGGLTRLEVESGLGMFIMDMNKFISI